VPTHVALLRGVNVGGHNPIDMAELREIAVGLGHQDVATHLRSGNLLFTPGATDVAGLAAELEAALEARTGRRIAIVVLARDELARAVAGNPYCDTTDPKQLHVVFRAQQRSAEEADAIRAAVLSARQAGSPDEAALVGETLYLRTPDGLGRSDLATRLTRAKDAGTARNWATVTALLSLLSG
jgi:uncharacterized protein (DUF1697 family)